MDNSKVRRWRCEICLEEFEGDEPPVPCPVCGADRDQFIEISLKNQIKEKLSSSNKSIVIIGNGAAGYYAAKTIREQSRNAHITMISSEEYLSYYRPQVSTYLSMKRLENSMFISPIEWYINNNIDIKLAQWVKEINTSTKIVILESGEEISYDKLILANGSRNSVLPIKGIEKKNVFTLRNIKDANNIKNSMSQGKNAIVIGGGLLGLEAAWQLKQAGLNVTVVEFAPTLLSRQLDKEGADIFKTYIDAADIPILLRESVEEILGSSSVHGIKLKSGKLLEADMVLFSVGIIPNKELIQNTSIITNRGILVNEKMETNLDDIYACGDVAEINGKIYGNWSSAIEMGKVAGLNALGIDSLFKDFIPSTIFDEMGVKIFSCGEIDSSYETLIIKDSAESFLQKLFFKDNILVGGYIIGNTASAQNIVNSIKKNKTLNEIKNSILK